MQSLVHLVTVQERAYQPLEGSGREGLHCRQAGFRWWPCASYDGVAGPCQDGVLIPKLQPASDEVSGRGPVAWVIELSGCEGSKRGGKGCGGWMGRLGDGLLEGLRAIGSSGWRLGRLYQSLG
jgi:hypothetical protein